MNMVRCLTTVAAFIGSALLLAGPGAAQPVTGHSSNDAVLDAVDIGSVAQGRIGDRGGLADTEIGLGPATDALFFTGQFDWMSGETYDWTLSYEPQSVGGAVTFELGGFSRMIPTVTPLNSFFIRTSAELSNTSIRVSGLSLGPPPSGGGGGVTIFETGSLGTPASSFADGNAAPLDILKISNVDLLAGFTLAGQVTMVFPLGEGQPVGEQLVFEVFAADDGNPPGVVDTDGDGIPDDGDGSGVVGDAPCPDGVTENCDDNCKEDGNADQADSDGDGRGDVCDNCPDDPNPGQEDEDGDDAGDACDNCPVGCTLVEPPTGTCRNRSQDDFDGDGVGDRCDICKLDFNPPGPDGIQPDACPNTWLNLDVFTALTTSGTSPGAGALSVIGASVVADPASDCLADPACVQIDISIDCGEPVAFANIGLNLTGSPAPTFTGFAESGPPDGADDNRRDFAGAPAPLDPARLLGDTVSSANSDTIGPDITVRGSPPLSMVILRLQGNQGGDNLICDPPPGETREVVLGPLFLNGYVPGSNPLSAAGFDTFTPELSQLAGPTGPLEDDQIIFRVRAPGSRVTLQLEPAPEPDSDRRYLLSIESDDETTKVKRLAVGFTAPSAAEAVGMKFVGCETPGVGEFPPAFGGAPNTCPLPKDPKLGSNVLVPTLFSSGTPIFTTYTVDPDAGSDGRVPNTLYVGLQAQDESLNTVGSGNRINLGVVEFPAATPTPQITFEKAETLPGFEPVDGGPIQDFVEGALPTENVSLTSTFSPDEDTDNDAVPDEIDNCLFVKNGSAEDGQLNSGGMGFVAADSDFIGNACTCGDPSGDGIGDNGDLTGAGGDPQDDVTICQELLALPFDQQPAAGTPEAEQAERCRVTPGDGSFGIIDAVVLELESQQLTSGIGDAFSGALQSCAAADAQQ